jgi:hypothetical protein
VVWAAAWPDRDMPLTLPHPSSSHPHNAKPPAGLDSSSHSCSRHVSRMNTHQPANRTCRLPGHCSNQTGRLMLDRPDPMSHCEQQSVCLMAPRSGSVPACSMRPRYEAAGGNSSCPWQGAG